MGLNDYPAIPAIAVSDMARAREFYEGVLGLATGEERPDGGIRYPCGGGTAIHVYPSPDNAGSSTATVVGFDVEDVEETVDELAARGVTFERYDGGPIVTDERGVARIGDAKVAWFKDPDGNILGIDRE